MHFLMRLMECLSHALGVYSGMTIIGKHALFGHDQIEQEAVNILIFITGKSKQVK